MVVEDEETRTSCENSIRTFLLGKSSPDAQISELRKKIDGNRLFSNHEKLGEKIPSQVDVYRDVNFGRTIVEVKAPDQVACSSSCENDFTLQFYWLPDCYGTRNCHGYFPHRVEE